MFWRRTTLVAPRSPYCPLEIGFSGCEPYVQHHPIESGSIYVRFRIGITNTSWNSELCDLRVDWDRTPFTDYFDEELQRNGLDAAPMIAPREERLVFLFGILEDRSWFDRDRVLRQCHRFTVSVRAGRGGETTATFLYDPGNAAMLVRCAAAAA